MTASSSAFEVWCPRCDVSFPVETKRCVHCGGATTKTGRSRFDASAEPSNYESDESRWSHSHDDSHYEGDSGHDGGLSQESSAASEDGIGRDELFQLPDFGAGESEAEVSNGPVSTLQSVIRSLGGFIWVIVFVAFTLVRNCVGE